VRDADLVIGAVLIAGAAAPKLVTEAMVKTMKAGAVLVDIAIDQGGCFETSRPTTHAEPTYVRDGVIHYCVTNMPGAVPRTSTVALTNATLPVRHARRRGARSLADLGWRHATAKDPGLGARPQRARGTSHARRRGARARDSNTARSCTPRAAGRDVARGPKRNVAGERSALR
jgi:alanine dehydrogenase